MMTSSKKTTVIFAVPAFLLLVPLIAMQFTKEVNWTFSDFIVAAVLLFGTAGIINYVRTHVKSSRNRILLSLLVLGILVLFWAELAVGIFGSPFAGS